MATDHKYGALSAKSKQIRVLMFQPISISEEDDGYVNGHLNTMLDADHDEDGNGNGHSDDEGV